MKPNHETIYLVPTDYDGGQLTYSWCDCPAPGEGMDPEDAIKYVRADLVPASNELLARRIVELTNERDATKYKLAGVLDEISDFCASLDGALMANQSADELADDIQRRLDIYGISTSDNVLHPDDLAVDRFAPAMKTKLAASRAKGRGGWDDKASCSGEHLAQLLIEHLTKGNAGTFEDIANFAMMLHQRGEDPQLLRTALVLRDSEIKAQAVETEYKDLLHVVANQYDGNDSTEWSIGANHVFRLFAKEVNKRANQLYQQAKAGGSC